MAKRQVLAKVYTFCMTNAKKIMVSQKLLVIVILSYNKNVSKIRGDDHLNDVNLFYVTLKIYWKDLISIYLHSPVAVSILWLTTLYTA